jgi:peptidoglycan-associated lipoprotein
MEKNKMKKLLSLFCTIICLSGCSMFGADGGLFSGADCESRLARDFSDNSTDTVFFAFDSSALSAEAQAALDTQAAWLKKHDNVNAIVQGYCDERGTREYNLALGERRANAVKQYLVSQGIDESRISTISYGKERPFVLGSNEGAWAQNRRAVTVISSAE